jgi:hypothetical protein
VRKGALVPLPVKFEIPSSSTLGPARLAWKKRLAFVFATCLAITSCSQINEPVAVHMQANQYQNEHDEVVSTEAVIDYYPNRTTPQEVVVHRNTGGMIDATCKDAECSDISLKITGSKLIPDGSYEFLKTDDPNIIMVREGDGTRTLGYLAKNKGGGGFQFYSDLQEAQAYEHKGDAARTAGKIALGVLLAAAIVAVAAAAGAAAAHSDQVTTHCTTFGNNTTCTSN